eukprot:9334031-Alexandrium_andersonii.AAC.1
MSASLVGSEMCIRDRCRSSRGASDGQRRKRRMSPTSMAAAPQTRPLSPCLLYTSDAADDM